MTYERALWRAQIERVLSAMRPSLVPGVVAYLPSPEGVVGKAIRKADE